MAIDYPDVIGEYMYAPNRYEIDGLQYVGLFEPERCGPGAKTKFVLCVQNVVEASREVLTKITSSEKVQGKPILEVQDSEINLQLAKAEVGLLTVPIVVHPQARRGEAELDLEIRVKGSKAERIRQPRKAAILPNQLIDDVTGLNLVGIIGSTYQVQKDRKSKFKVMIDPQGGGEPLDDNVAHSYQSLWTVDDVASLQTAQRQINQDRSLILGELKIEPVFTALYAETQQRFADAGVPLRIGEALALGKLFTYATQYFLPHEDWQNALLCPIWERAIQHDVPTDDPIEVFRYVGYNHLLRLTANLSFGLMAQAHEKHLWSQEERRGVAEFLVEALTQGGGIEVDFLYLPLMLGAVNVFQQVSFPAEDMADSIQLLKQAHQARLASSLFADPDMAQAGQLYETLLQKI